MGEKKGEEIQGRDSMALHHKGGEAVDMTTCYIRTCYCVCLTTVSREKIKCH